MNDLKNFINKMKMTSVDIKFINNPNEFKKRLIELSNSTFISIITLYLGIEKEDEELLLSFSKCKNLSILSDSLKNHRTDPSLLLKRLNINDKVKIQKKIISIPFLRELIFVQHCKMYVFDDIIILTGANCESRYFTITLDNHYEIKSKKLSIEILNLMSIHDKRFLFHSNYLKTLPLIQLLPFELNNNNTFIKPYTEKDEFNILKTIIKFSEKNTLYLSTGYLNLPSEYLNLFKDKNIRIYCPPSEYNLSFNIIGKFIEYLYLYIYYRTKNILGNKIFIFYKKGFKFHKKGLWIFKGEIAIHLLGSSNFNMRSFKRDFELNYILITKDKQIKNKLWEDIRYIEKYSKQLNNQKYSFFKKILYGIIFLLLKSFM